MKHKIAIIVYSILSSFFLSTVSHAQQLHHLTNHELIARQYIAKEHSSNFSKLQVQDFQGRIKPIQTMALELLRKIHGRSNYEYLDGNGDSKQLNATQLFLGMHFKPDSWQLLPLIKIEQKAKDSLSKILNDPIDSYAKPASFFDFTGAYRLKKQVALAYSKAQGKRNAFDKDLLKIDERINIVWTLFSGQFLRIFPNNKTANNKWFAPRDPEAPFVEKELILYNQIIPTYLVQLQKGIDTNNWTTANETVELLHTFQTQNAGSLLLSDQRVNWELFYNNKNIFFVCMIGYTLLGTLLLILSFLLVFFDNKWFIRGSRVFMLGIWLIFIYHLFGILLRWYISGHAPWSNGYEATVFIASIGVLAGLLFSSKTSFPSAATALIACCLLGIAHGNLMSPEVTNLVPVLKSYWLMIHVAIITGSYGFLTLGSLLALISLTLMTLIRTHNATKIRSAISQLLQINEHTTVIGLFMLTIGTFLGGIWANESWGRYWGWDPKETWALISITIYAFVLHIRIIFKKDHIFIYNVSSLFALGSLIMTFFGVNYYLSGLHSYAKGDSFPIPDWIFIIVPLLILLSILAKYTWKKFQTK